MTCAINLSEPCPNGGAYVVVGLKNRQSSCDFAFVCKQHSGNMDDQTCYPATTWILATTLVWCGTHQLSSFLMPTTADLVRADKQWQWRSTFTYVVYALVMSIWCPLALMQSSFESKQDNIVTRFSCSSYHILCSAWTHYIMELLNLMIYMRKWVKFRTVVHHLVAIAWLSLGILGKTHVCLLSAAELMEIDIFFGHLRKLMALSGLQRNGRFYRLVTKVRTVSFIGIRPAMFIWFQWQFFHHREDMETTWLVFGVIAVSVIAAHNCIVGKMLINGTIE